MSYISLDQDLGLEKVCDIFTQLNSKDVRLDVFDLMNALLKPKGLQLKHIWREAAPSPEFVETPKMNVYVLQVMSILKQAYCSPRYLYYLLPGEKKKVRDAEDGSLREDIDVLREDHVVIEDSAGRTYLVSEVLRYLAREHYRNELDHVPPDRQLLESKVPPAYGGSRRDQLAYVRQLPPYGDFAFYLYLLDERQLLRLSRSEAKTILWARES